MDSSRVNSIRLRAGARQASQNEGDMSMANMSVISDSYVTREFNQAFSFLQAKAEKVSADDDAIDSNLKRCLLDLMDDQRMQVQRAWLINKTRIRSSQDFDGIEGGVGGAMNEIEDGSFQDFIDLLSDIQLDELLRLILPVIKLEPGKYLIGTKVRQIQFKNNNLIARVGGGYMNLSQALAAEAKINCLQIALQMEKKSQTFKEAMIDLLTQKKASEKVLRQFQKDKSNEQIPFQPVMQAIKAREGKNWQQRKIRERLESRNDDSALSSPNSSPNRSITKNVSGNRSKAKLSFVVSKTMKESEIVEVESDGASSRIRDLHRSKSLSSNN